MNKVEIVGRLSKDTFRPSEKMLRLTVAAQRKYKNADGKRDADFINCIAFNGTADFIEKNFKKGDAIGISGRIQTSSYEKDGETIYATDVMIEEVEFVERKNSRED